MNIKCIDIVQCGVKDRGYRNKKATEVMKRWALDKVEIEIVKREQLNLVSEEGVQREEEEEREESHGSQVKNDLSVRGYLRLTLQKDPGFFY